MKQTVNIITEADEQALVKLLNDAEESLNRQYACGRTHEELRFTRGYIDGVMDALNVLGIDYKRVFNPLSGI